MNKIDYVTKGFKGIFARLKCYVDAICETEEICRRYMLDLMYMLCRCVCYVEGIC
jgi:hypothetical protein